MLSTFGHACLLIYCCVLSFVRLNEKQTSGSTSMEKIEKDTILQPIYLGMPLDKFKAY